MAHCSTFLFVMIVYCSDASAKVQAGPILKVKKPKAVIY